MELRHLRYFRAVAEELHFGRAAQRLLIAQPPLSQQIRQLERELGAELLIRSTRNVALTPAGLAFLGRTIAILDAVDDAADLARRVADGTTGRLTVGCVGSATYSVLPQLVRALSELLPDVDVRVRGEMLAPAQLAALAAGEIDLALLRPPVIDPGLSTEIIRRDSLLVALPEGHRLSKRKRLAIGDLREEDLVAHAGGGRSVMGSLLATLCADAGFTPRVRHEVDETSTLVTLVAAGLGLRSCRHRHRLWGSPVWSTVRCSRAPSVSTWWPPGRPLHTINWSAGSSRPSERARCDEPPRRASKNLSCRRTR